MGIPGGIRKAEEKFIRDNKPHSEPCDYRDSKTVTCRGQSKLSSEIVAPRVLENKLRISLGFRIFYTTQYLKVPP